MSTTTHEIKSGDDNVTFTDSFAIDGTAVSTVSFRLVNVSTGTAAIDDASATIVTQSTAVLAVSYQPSLAELATVGLYRGEWKLTYSDATVRRPPTDDYITVNIIPNLD